MMMMMTVAYIAMIMMYSDDDGNCLYSNEDDVQW